MLTAMPTVPLPGYEPVSFPPVVTDDPIPGLIDYAVVGRLLVAPLVGVYPAEHFLAFVWHEPGYGWHAEVQQYQDVVGRYSRQSIEALVAAIRRSHRPVEPRVKIDWDFQHTNNGEYVSDHNVAEAYTLLGLSDLLTRPRCRVLEVGIGRDGTSIRELATRHEVVAVDISEVALDKVRGIAEVFLTADLRRCAPVDVALSHVTVQHCDAPERAELLGNVLAVLAPEGRFHFQYADAEPDADVVQGVTFPVSPAQMAEEIAEAGGTVQAFWRGPRFPSGIQWHVCVAGRR